MPDPGNSLRRGGYPDLVFCRRERAKDKPASSRNSWGFLKMTQIDANPTVENTGPLHLRDLPSRPVSETQIADMFNRIAPRYDLLNGLLSLRQDHRWRQRLVSLIPYKPGGALLDVATGTGDVLFSALTKRREYTGFTGIDISRDMLVLAERKASTRQVTSLTRFESMSAEQIGLPDNSQDCVTISFGLRNVVNKDEALAEFQRVLKPRGTLLIMEFFTPESSLMARLFDFYFHKILPVVGGLISDRAAYTYLPKSVSAFYSADELRGALYRSGFIVNQEVSFLFGGCKIIQARCLS